MKNIKELMKTTAEFKEFCDKRGYELMMASGCTWVMEKKSEGFDINGDEINLIFCEDTNQVNPDRYSVTLKEHHLSQSDNYWEVYIKDVKSVKELSDKLKEEELKRQELENKKYNMKNLKKN